ncbi:MAG: VanZ family protein [Thermodesulfobacteriota bacterium]|nr:VanZ family protein [Thermodesulfobacteriota bacterium]
MNEPRENCFRFQKFFFALWAAGIFLLAAGTLFSGLMPPYTTLLYRISLDNVLHFAIFLLLALISPFAFHSRSKIFPALLFLALLGIALEVWQGFIPNRRCTLSDSLANILGLVLGAAAGFWLRKRLPPRSPSTKEDAYRAKLIPRD